MYKDFLKPIFDFLIAIVVLMIFSPIILMIMIGLVFYNRGTPFFMQQRPGKNEKIFKLIKFKTMRDAYGENGKPLPDKERITPVGAWVRKLSLDELPQLINVIKGDMSLIGPRPLFVRYLPYYTKREALRHSVRPGITGLAQVNGRNFLDWNKRLELDAQYVENISFINDIKIALLTIKNVVARKDIAVIPGAIGKPLDIERAKK